MTPSKVFPPKILKGMPGIGDTDGMRREDVKIHIKVFDPVGSGTWYLTEYDPEQRNFYGLCKINDEPNFGYVSQDELLSIKRPFGLTLERDLHMGEMTMQQAVDYEKRWFPDWRP